MSNRSNYNYETIDNPYNSNLSREEGNIIANTSNSFSGASNDKISSPSQFSPNVIDGATLSNFWIESWIKSKNYKPKVQGFLIDGRRGYIECMDMYVAGTTSMKGDVTIGDYEGGQGIFYDASEGVISYKNIGWSAIEDDDGNKPEDNATVGAAWNVNLFNIPDRVSNSATVGINLTDSYLGYYNGSSFQSYIDENGNFQFKGDNDNYVNWNGTTLNVRGKLNANDISSGILNSSLITVEGEDSARTKITGNDIFLYDDTTGGTNPPTGNSATLNFPRSDNINQSFIIKKRSGKNDDNENVMEMYYNKNAENNGKNYVFLGISGLENSANDWHTDAVRLGAKGTIQIGTSTIYASTSHVGDLSEIMMFTKNFSPELEEDVTQTWVSGVRPIANELPMFDLQNSSLTNLGGGGLAFTLLAGEIEYPENSGNWYSLTDVFMWMDYNGICLGDKPILPLTNNGSDLGSSGHGFANLYIDKIYASNTNIRIVNTLEGSSGKDIGTTNHRFRDIHSYGTIYCKNIEGSGDISCDDISCDDISCDDIAGDTIVGNKFYTTGHSSSYLHWNSTLSKLEIVGNLFINGTLSKSAGSFIIDHPLKPKTHFLQHSFVESPEMMNVYKGNAFIKNGICKIKMPDWFSPLNGENQADYSYLLTSIGSKNNLWVKKEMKKGIVVFAGENDGKFSYLISATRHDKYAEKNRIKVEVLKK